MHLNKHLFLLAVTRRSTPILNLLQTVESLQNQFSTTLTRQASEGSLADSHGLNKRWGLALLSQQLTEKLELVQDAARFGFHHKKPYRNYWERNINGTFFFNK